MPPPLFVPVIEYLTLSVVLVNEQDETELEVSRVRGPNDVDARIKRVVVEPFHLVD